MLEALGNIGDFVGGIGVVVTLIYLAIQIRINSKTVKSAAAESVMQSMSEFFRAMAQTPGGAALIERGFTEYDALERHQQLEFYLWLFSWFRLAEVAHHHYSSGQLPEAFWAGQVAHLKSLLKNESVRAFWAVRKTVFSTGFRAFVDDLDLEGSAPTTLESIMSMETNDAAWRSG